MRFLPSGTYIHSGIVLSCGTTDRPPSHAPVAASGPHTASMKSATMPSRSVEFHEDPAPAQSAGRSSVTTTRGYAYHGENRTYAEPRSCIAVK